MHRIGLGDLLPPVGHDQRHQGTGAGDRCEHQLQHPHRIVQGDRARPGQAGVVQQGPRQPGQARQRERRGREGNAQDRAEVPQPHLTGIAPARLPIARC